MSLNNEGKIEEKKTKEDVNTKWEEKKFGRFIEKNEIIIEDLTEEELLMIGFKMNKKEGYYLEYWKAPKQKSGHLHIKNINLPENCSILFSNKYKELIIKKYVTEDLWNKVDWSFYNRGEDATPHRIVKENTEHYKGYGKKTLVKSWGETKDKNVFEEEIWEKAIKQAEERKIFDKDITDWKELIEKIIPYWITGKRQELCLSVAGYLRKNLRVGMDTTKSIISEICKQAKDTEISMRLKAVEETFKKDERDVKGISGLEFLKGEGKEKNLFFSEENKEKIEHPKTGKLISIFANQISEILKKKNTLFYRPTSKDIVEIGKIKDEETNEEKYTGFVSITPNRFITLLEKYTIPGVNLYNPKIKAMEFHEKSISPGLAQTLLVSQILQDKLPKIVRIFTTPLPIIYKEKLTFPKKGYDKRFSSWMDYDAPEISNPEMELKEAKEILYNLFKEFCFKTKKDYNNAIAGLLTPFLRGLFKEFNTRTPVFFYLANRERAGKDYLAGITGITYEGQALEESPICSGERSGNNNEELRKKITSAIINGRKRLHFSNNKGYINNAVFEFIVTAENYSDRLLGKNKIIKAPNELDFSLSGNVGVTFTPDFANRCKFVNLFLEIEDANARKFQNPNLHNKIKEERPQILSALFALVRNWINNGQKEGEVAFASFSEWAKICGGIMESAGYENPCKADCNIGVGDNETKDMKLLFELCFEEYPNTWIKRNEIKNIILNENNDIFGYYNFDTRSDQTKFGKQLTKFVGRVFSKIKLITQDSTLRGSRQKYKFTKELVKVDKQAIFGKKVVKSGNVGNVGNLCNLKLNRAISHSIGVTQVPNVPNVATKDNSNIDFNKLDFGNSNE